MPRSLTIVVLVTVFLSAGCWESRPTPEEGNRATDLMRRNSIRFKATGSEVVPPVITPVFAQGGCCYFNGQGLNLVIKVEKLSSKVIAAHIHSGPKGQFGKVVFDFPSRSMLVEDNGASTSFHALWEISETDFKALKAGYLYLDVHTELHPNGEVRAQLPVAPGW